MTSNSVSSTANVLATSRLSRVLIAVLRVGVALLWIQSVGWKDPPTFGEGPTPSGLYQFTRFAVEYPVFAPYTWLVEHLILPNFTFFAWAVLFTESALGAFLLIGLATRFWAIAGIAQTVAIALSVLNAPNEWHWTYLLMVLAHVALFATAAGRYAGLDAALRPGWQASRSSLARLLVRAS